jgi:hypothetical protein
MTKIDVVKLEQVKLDINFDEYLQKKLKEAKS